MVSTAEVRLWGRTIGAVSYPENSRFAYFEYMPEFIDSGIEVAPVMMPLGRSVYSFPSLSFDTFHGLPGLLADSLPDKFGNALIDAWLAQQGRNIETFSPVERLCYTGTRGMGALEFFPSTGPDEIRSEKLDVDRLVKFASDILRQKEQLMIHLIEDEAEEGLLQILRVGTSAGGARAKAVIAWNPDTDEIVSGQLSAPAGFRHWLIKFDGVSSNRDKELNDPHGYGIIEFAYSNMAGAAGIDMCECRLFEENGRKHFMTRRFDRTDDGHKIHMQSLGALGHFDFNLSGAASYEQAFMICRQLGLGADSVEQLYRRMIFNVIARNQDDHVKNISFLMDRKGLWSLSPAYDVTYSYNPGGLWTGVHQMSINGKRDNFTIEDFLSAERNAGLKRGSAKRILDEVQTAVNRWLDIAAAAGVEPENARRIQSSFRIYDL